MEAAAWETPTVRPKNRTAEEAAIRRKVRGWSEAEERMVM